MPLDIADLRQEYMRAGLAESDAMRVWVLIHEQPEGTWGAGGQVVNFAELRAAAQAAKSADA